MRSTDQQPQTLQRLTAVFVVALLVTTGCIAKIPLDPTRPINIHANLLGGLSYQQDGRELSKDSIRFELRQFPDAHAQMRTADAFKAFGLILSFLGGAAVGWGLGPGASDDGDADSGLVAGGIISGLVGVGLGAAAIATFEDAVRTYNETFDLPAEPSDPSTEIEEGEASRDPHIPGFKVSPIYAAGRDGGILGAHISF